MAFNLTLGNHPSQAIHPATGKPWFDAENKPVPKFPDQRSIRLDGYVIAYVSELGNIAFIAPYSRLPKGVREEAKELVEREFMAVSKIAAPPEQEPTNG